jgi:hypothetical protein
LIALRVILFNCASAMLAAAMAMRLRKTLGSSQQLRLRHSLNGFCSAHDHAGRLSAMHECRVAFRRVASFLLAREYMGELRLTQLSHQFF